jgi:hypothetical protein
MSLKKLVEDTNQKLEESGMVSDQSQQWKKDFYKGRDPDEMPTPQIEDMIDELIVKLENPSKDQTHSTYEMDDYMGDLHSNIRYLLYYHWMKRPDRNDSKNFIARLNSIITRN